MSIKRWKLGWKRCDCVKCEAALTIEQTEEDCGWVTWGDHKDEIARLKADFHQAHDERADYAKDVSKLKAEVERLTDENTRLTMMKDAFKRMIKRRDKWILEQKTEVERLNGCQMIEATYVVSPEDAERIRRRLEREKGGHP